MSNDLPKEVQDGIDDALRRQPDMTQERDTPAIDWQSREIDKALRELRRDMWQWRD